MATGFIWQDGNANKNIPPYSLKFWHITAWTASSILFLAILLTDYDFPGAVARTVSNLLVLMALYYINALVLMPRYLEKRRYWQYGFGLAGLLGGAIGIRIGINRFFSNTIFPPLLDRNTQVVVFVIATSLLILLLSSALRLLSNHYQAEIRYKEAQLQFLKSQINPHFLFNTLNNIYALSILQPQHAPEAVLQLSELLRYAVYESRNDKVKLSKELTHLQQFIQLSQLHNPQAIQITLQLENTNNEAEIEPLLLLPLVENALKHSDRSENPLAYIRIFCQATKDKLLFKITNSHQPQSQEKDQVGGVGLENIRHRLQLRYADNYQLEISEKEQEFEVSLRINF